MILLLTGYGDKKLFANTQVHHICSIMVKYYQHFFRNLMKASLIKVLTFSALENKSLKLDPRNVCHMLTDTKK